MIALVAISPYSKCTVQYVPSGSNDHGWRSDAWLGGFHSLCGSDVYDLAGRQIRPGPFSPTSFPENVGDLARAKIEMEPAGLAKVTISNR